MLRQDPGSPLTKMVFVTRVNGQKRKKINWKKRQALLKKIFSKKNNNYDCIVPVSGGKDGSYISYMLKKKFKINPLCVTVRPFRTRSWK